MILKKILRGNSPIFAFVLASLLVLATGCGSSTGSNMGGGNPPPPPTGPPTNPNTGQWTWMGGSSTVGRVAVGPPGVYGTQGVADPANIPGGRKYAAVWKDKNGNVWIFGGAGFGSAAGPYSLNDLWEFTPATKQWTWIDGSKIGDQSGVYGTQGVAAASNVPGGRYGAAAWTDAKGNLWLFGGNGFDSQDNEGYLNDLWEFDISTKKWTWIGGNSTLGEPNLGRPGVYGTLGVPAAANAPGSRAFSAYWVDSSGNFWLFGGYGADARLAPDTRAGDLNDLWKFDPSAKIWTWMGGSEKLDSGGSNAGGYGTPGVYGTQGVASAQSVPGGRQNSNGWTDSGGNFWLFGGFGKDSVGATGELNDLWEFNVSSRQWTWISGSDTISPVTPPPPGRYPAGLPPGKSGVYGTEGTPSTANLPGARQDFTAWTDRDGNFWLFGGRGIDSVGVYGLLNDLWKFDPSTKTWTWMGGSDTETRTNIQYPFLGIGTVYPYTTGVYGTLGTPAAGNVPGSRSAPVSWGDSSGNLWLFGGYGADSTGAEGYLNDLWEYIP